MSDSDALSAAEKAARANRRAGSQVDFQKEAKEMKISVIGAGYVGLATAACLSQIGHDVFCGESDIDKLSKLQSGVMPLFEPHLEKVIEVARSSGRLHFGSTGEAIDWGHAIFICVGTPRLANGDADLSAIEGVARAIAKRASGYRLVIEKSTVPVQTGSQLKNTYRYTTRTVWTATLLRIPSFCAKARLSRIFSILIGLWLGSTTRVPPNCCAKSTNRLSRSNSLVLCTRIARSVTIQFS